MNRLFGIPALLLVLCCAGCYSLPKQRCTWIGEGRSVTLYDAEQRGCACAALQITEGPALKKFVPQQVVLVNSKLETFSTNEYTGKLRVTGLIMSDYPTCAANGKVLLSYKPNPVGQLGAIYILKVSKIESY